MRFLRNEDLLISIFLSESLSTSGISCWDWVCLAFKNVKCPTLRCPTLRGRAKFADQTWQLVQFWTRTQSPKDLKFFKIPTSKNSISPQISTFPYRLILIKSAKSNEISRSWDLDKFKYFISNIFVLRLTRNFLFNPMPTGMAHFWTIWLKKVWNWK